MKKILLIEDNTEVRENTAEILELANYQVFTAPHGKIGVELARKEHPDLIICDIMMPELDGYGVLHLLSKNPATAGIPFIFLTAKAEKDDFRKGMNLGADDYLTKPFDDLTLLDAIEMRLKKNDLFRAESRKESAGTAGEGSRGLAELNRLLNEDKKTVHIKKKQQVFSEHSFPNALYYISKGKIKTYKTNEEGREFITGLHAAGDFIGYIELLENCNYKESATALEDSELCVINKPEFFTLLEQNREVSQKFIKLLSNNVIEQEERLLQLAYNSVRKRVAEALLLLYNRYHGQETGETAIQVSREDLSSIAGASKETVIRTLSDFKDEKLIEISGKSIKILNMNKLLKMKN
ncbi:response regulator [Rhodocytophaga rosea]|uniref:Response regulator n=1 Tax=Rhodocytophaga rosea TaxID=2704465 RepID=A0A6C0GIF5_9BACT|nr:response regulator [Rhodocytophaga rosea]QHT67614.1 response regulator [Rhodocytophaga rosea]